LIADAAKQREPDYPNKYKRGGFCKAESISFTAYGHQNTGYASQTLEFTKEAS
jgi:hypothetical protein